MKLKTNPARSILCLLITLCLMLQVGIIPASAIVADSPHEPDYIQSDNWIWASDTVSTNSTAYFRKALDLTGTPEKIDIKTSGHNFMKFFINGNLISGLSSPAPTSLPDDKAYLVYSFSGGDLAALLNANPRQIAFGGIVTYYGLAGLNYVTGKPGFWAEITVTHADGGTQVIETGTDWSALKDTPYANGTVTQQPRTISAKINYDARKMPDPYVFATYGYDESSYTAGAWTAAFPADAETVSYKLRPQMIPEGKVHQVIHPVKAGTQTATRQCFDAGQIVSGFPRITVSGALAGTTITVYYSETLASNGNLNRMIANDSGTNYNDSYTFSGVGTESFCPDFAFKAFRYFEVNNMGRLLDESEVTVEWASTGIDNTSSFVSSNNLLNKIYDACINTQINNVQGMPVDCPHREQAQYLGDSQSQYDLLSYAFTDFTTINYKTLMDFAAGQRADGRFDYITPSSQHNLVIPEYDLRYTDMLYTYYWYSGKTDALQSFYGAAVKNVNYYYNTYMRSNGLIAKTSDWHISDWPEPKVDESGQFLTVFNLHMYDALNKLSMVAELIGEDDDAVMWAEKAALLSAAINAQLVDANGIYYDCLGSSSKIHGVTAYAIFVGQANPRFRERQLDYIATMYNAASTAEPTTRVILTRVAMHVLMQGGAKYKDIVYKMITKENGWEWGKMINMGYKTVWEDFGDRWSHSHAWTAFPAKILLQYFVGVNYESPGYSDVVIKPFLPDGLNTFTGSVSPVRGKIETTMTRLSTDSLRTVVSLPAGDPIVVGVPRFANKNTTVSIQELPEVTIFEDGRRVQGYPGITYLSNDEEYIYFTCESGRVWTFLSSVKTPGTAESYNLTVDATSGGSLKINGTTVNLPYTVSLTTGTSVTIEAVPDTGMKFNSFSGTYASSKSPLTFDISSDTLVWASFGLASETGNTYGLVTIDAPVGAGLTVEFNGAVRELPTQLFVKNGSELRLKAGKTDNSKYEFVAWSGAIFSANEEISVISEDGLQLKVIGAYAAMENLALNKPATDATANPVNSTWSPSYLTDGYTVVAAARSGYTSNTYPSQEPSVRPFFTINLQSRMTFDTVVLYPRLDTLDSDGSTLGFPISFLIRTSNDGTNYNEGFLVENHPNPWGEPQTFYIGETTAQYVRVETIRLGNYSDAWRVQLLEVEIYNSKQVGDGTLSIAKIGNGQVKINGKIENLPLTATYPNGTMLAIEPFPEPGYRFIGTSGTYSASEAIQYCVINSDISLTLEFGSLTALKSGNLARGKTVSAISSEGAAAQWSPNYMTDGLTVSTGGDAVSGIKGYTSKAYSNKNCSADSPYVSIDLGANYDFSQLVLYPRTDVPGANGGTESPNFPEAFELEYRMQGDGAEEWHHIASFTNITNPQSRAAEFDFPLQNGRYIRIRPTQLGSPAYDDRNNASPYRFQLCEVEVYANPAAGTNLAAMASLTASVAANSDWVVGNLIDGNLRSGGRNRGTPASTGSNGYSSLDYGAYPTYQGVLTTPVFIQFSYANPVEFNRFVMYPRSNLDGGLQAQDPAVTGMSPNQPVSFEIQVSNTGLDSDWVPVYVAVDAPNSKLAPIVCTFPKTQGKFIRLYVTKVGVPAVDEIARVQRVQLAAVRIENLATEFTGFGSVAVDTADGAPKAIWLHETLGLEVLVQDSDLPSNNIVWSLENEDGVVSDIATLIGSDGNSPTLQPLKEGQVYAVARNENGLAVSGRILITLASFVPYTNFRYGNELALELLPGILNAEALVLNLDDTPQTIYLALYNKDGKLLSLVQESKGLVSRGTKLYNVSVDIPTDIDSNAYVKVYIWESQTYVPIVEAVVFPDNG